MTATDPDAGPTGPLSAPEAHPPAVPPPAAEPQRPVQNGRGILLMCIVSLLFATQDALSRKLGSSYSPILVVMLRYWFMVIFVSVIVGRAPGGFRAAVRSRRPWLQIARALLLVTDIVLAIFAFVRLGIVNAHAILASYPLMIVAMSGPILGERIGWRRWTAVAVGFVGMLIVLQPGSGAMSRDMLFPLGAAATFALYGVLTRLASRDDSSTVSFFWTSMWGAAAITVAGLMHWEALAPRDWALIAALCLCAATSHWLLIHAYQLAEASVLQPFAYTQLFWVVLIGTVFLGEELAPNVIVGVSVIVSAGLFSLWRARVRAAEP